MMAHHEMISGLYFTMVKNVKKKKEKNTCQTLYIYTTNCAILDLIYVYLKRTIIQLYQQKFNIIQHIMVLILLLKK